MRKNMVTAGLLGISLGVAVIAGAQQPGYGGNNEPRLNVNPGLHGNIARAQELSRQAYDAMTAAQQANEFDMGGHAARAKDLLRQANDEMKQAALAANRNK